METNGLEEQADNAKARELFWKPLSWLGTIRPTSANDAFDPALWETFVSTTLGLEVPILAALPRLNNSPARTILLYHIISARPLNSLLWYVPS